MRGKKTQNEVKFKSSVDSIFSNKFFKRIIAIVPIIWTCVLIISAISGVVLGYRERSFLTNKQMLLGIITILCLFLITLLFFLLSQAKKKLKELSKEYSDLLAAPKIDIIRPEQYLDIIKRIVEHNGPGELLLFNLELNTFSDPLALKELWGNVTSMPNLTRIKLALPPDKYERWVNIVTKQSHEFFRGEKGKKFLVCKYESANQGEDRIGFALFERQYNPGEHEWGALFLLNRPFIDDFGQYLHILEYRGKLDGLGHLRNVWNKAYSNLYEESASMIQSYSEIMRNGISVDQFLGIHKCENPVADKIRRVVGGQRCIGFNQQSMSPLPQVLSQTQPDQGGRHTFTLTYQHSTTPPNNKTELIKCHCKGLENADANHPLPCIIWATGFGDGERPKLAQILSRCFGENDRKMVKVFFTKSGEVSDTTCGRVKQDLEAVLDYVTHIPEVDQNRICIIGISLSGYLAAKIAAVNMKVHSLILVCTPFDIVKMLDNFRRRNQRGQPRTFVFSDFLKAQPEARISIWDDNPIFCNYFNHTVSAAHLVEIAVKGPRAFGRDSFTNALSEFAKSGRHAAIIYNEDDPIVRAEENIPHIKELQKCDTMLQDKLSLHTLPVGGHFYPTGQHIAYPFEVPEEDSENGNNENYRRTVRLMAKAIENCFGETIFNQEGS